EAAHVVLRATTVLPDICSRVCDQAMQCEGSCSWSLAGGAPVAIGALERFVADNAAVPGVGRTSERGVGLSVGIVGSGPAGIAAAWALVEAGAAVTVYERDSQPGGLLRWGIPVFTLPAGVSRRPWEQLAAAGAALVLGREVRGVDLELLRQDHDAVLVCTGAGEPLKLSVPGADLRGVWDATRFLTRASTALAVGHGFSDLDGGTISGEGAGGEEGRPATVLVLGAGNTAMDVARSARRLGARAICVDWMDRRFAPVRPDELIEAEAEGVQIRFGTTLDHLEGVDGQVCGAVLSLTRQDRADRRPEIVSVGAVREAVDLVVMAMGYRLDPLLTGSYPGLPVRYQDDGLPDRRWLASGILAEADVAFARHQSVGRLSVRREAKRELAGLARAERLWVAGDALIGPSTVVEAMAQGAEAARSILDHQPRRPGAARPGAWGRHVLIAVGSHALPPAAAAADDVATRLREAGLATKVLPRGQVGLAELGWADLLIVVADGRARVTRDWVATLPHLGGKLTALLGAYRVASRRGLAALQGALEGRGARVVATSALGRRDREGSLQLAMAATRALGASGAAGKEKTP
ncbi:MAG: FAD-dependent oxidoreductase, partial [Mycobacteriales bacterium]